MMDKVIQDVDVMKVVSSIGRRSKKLQAILLQAIERYIDKRSPEYEELRKLVLDETNNNARAVVRLIFGDIEFMIE